MSRAVVMYVTLLMRCRALLSRGPGHEGAAVAAGGLHVGARIRRFVGQHLIPARSEWVTIQGGLAKRLWMHLDLAHERTWWLGAHEPETQEALRQALGPGRVMYDIGAYIGFYALPAARLGTEVFAFEPDPESAARLRAHVARNGLGGNVKTVEAAAWSSSRPAITFRRGLPRSQGGVCWQDYQPVLARGGVIQVASLSLDDFVAHGGSIPDVIKVDVEGSESEVLKGASKVLLEHHPTLVVEVHSATQCAAVGEILLNAAYKLRWNIPPEGYPRQCFAVYHVSNDGDSPSAARPMCSPLPEVR